VDRTLGLILIAGGVVAVVIGLLALGGLLRWFGHLPGDFSHDSGNVKVFAPLTSMLIISVVLSIALALVNRLR
jgi:hypothetical protein